jgi:ABC-2 type transport system ATP-binding protein
MMALVRRLKAQGKTVLITSHRFAEMEDLCDRVAILDRGRLLLAGGVGELTGGKDCAALRLDRLTAAERGELRGWLGERGHSFETVTLPRTRLEHVYLAQVGRAGGGHGRAAAEDGG